MTKRARLGVLASGTGTVLRAILDAGLPVEAVILDRPCPAADLATGAGVAVEVVERESYGPDFDRVAYTHEDHLYIQDLATGHTQSFATPVAAHLLRTPAVSPDGSRIIFQVYRNGVWLLDVADGSMRCILQDPTAEEFAWAPDGRRVAFHSRRDGQWGIYVMAKAATTGGGRD